MVRIGNKGTYKHTGAESSKVCDINLYKNLLTSQNNSFTNGQYSGTFYITKVGSIYKQQSFARPSKKVLDYLLANVIMTTVEYLPGTLNMTADHQSWIVKDSSKWKLNPFIFKKICKVFWAPDIDLIASRISHQVPAYLVWKQEPFSEGTDVFIFNYLGGISRNTLFHPFVSQSRF